MNLEKPEFSEEARRLKYNIDKELKNLAKYKGSAVVRFYPLLNIAYQINSCKSDDRVTVNRYSTPGYNGVKLSTLVIEPKQNTDKLPCIILYHGGGFLLKAPCPPCIFPRY